MRPTGKAEEKESNAGLVGIAICFRISVYSLSCFSPCKTAGFLMDAPFIFLPLFTLLIHSVSPEAILVVRLGSIHFNSTKEQYSHPFLTTSILALLSQ